MATDTAFEAHLAFSGKIAALHLRGDLRDGDTARLRELLDGIAAGAVRRVVLHMADVTSVTGAVVRCLALGQQGLAPGTEVIVDGAAFPVRRALRLGGLAPFVCLVDAALAPAG
ncbi:anti-sigma factor antagonist [Streptomyces montanisoli]|uniref:Anti-sigma factor antagonist n=1 Tax=Streptomyces montanisoli TaxID=2798581 RepID=A0A940RSZ7_9ACTN|nr:anti-sigma factor antagonist [Streptomyces montanisoli]MBP0456292.1 anti-sigma factor antagonist [Streptomyces montanisoli]